MSYLNFIQYIMNFFFIGIRYKSTKNCSNIKDNLWSNQNYYVNYHVDCYIIKLYVFESVLRINNDKEYFFGTNTGDEYV